MCLAHSHRWLKQRAMGIMAVLMRGAESPMDENSDNTSTDGVRVAALSSWQEFHQQVCSLKSKRGYVWRGQRKDINSGWSLQSSFDREVRIKNQDERAKKLEEHLNSFREIMNKSYPNVLPQNDDHIWDIWALGQHYGLRTPLLDWTLSPYIAAYFAFNKEMDQDDQNDCYRYVYALNRSIERHLSKQKIGSQVVSSERSVFFVDQLPYPNPRFTVQKGVFTKAFQGDGIEEYAKSFSRMRRNEALIVEFRIPTKDREECLYQLRLMNIDHMSLLLDLHDVVNCCNQRL
jgi:hypothetical protein